LEDEKFFLGKECEDAKNETLFGQIGCDYAPVQLVVHWDFWFNNKIVVEFSCHSIFILLVENS
jgi:hypothetical protein